MQGKVHAAIGFGCLAVLSMKFPAGFKFINDVTVLPEIGLVTATFGSLLPDIDMQRTSMGMKHKVTSKVVNKVGGGHRGFTHTLVIPALLVALTVFAADYLASYYYLSLIACSLLFGCTFGYIMHIVADLFNGKGCPIF